MRKIIGISGSPVKGNSDLMLETVLNNSGLESEIVKLNDIRLNHCLGCIKCKDGFCKQDDCMKKLAIKLVESDVIVLSTPTYFDNVSALMKNFFDRCLPFYFSGGLKNKKAILLAIGNFVHNEKDKNGKCLWCKEEIISVKSTMKAMENFCKILEMEIIDSIYSIHGDPTPQLKELVEIATRLKDK